MAEGSLLPPASTPLERALDATVAARLAGLPAVVASLWNAATCPKALLPHLAWALSVDEWDEGWAEDRKRAAIAESRYIHQHKGTPAAVKRALSAAGQPGATVIERAEFVSHNGAVVRDGSRIRRGAAGWSTYRVVLAQAATIEQAHLIKRLLASSQRNCITLTAVDFRAAANRHNGAIFRDGAYSRGVVNTSI